MKRFIPTLSLAAGLILGACSSHHSAELSDTAPAWLEADSAQAIASRTAADFTISRVEIAEALHRRHPELSDADLDSLVAAKYLERKIIDGHERYHRKSVRNHDLLNPAYNGGARRRGDHASEARISFVDSVLNYYNGTNPRGLAHRVRYRFSIEVPYHEAIDGDTLRVWMPLPLTAPECDRQSNLSIHSASPAEYVLSDGRSAHNSIYFSAVAPTVGDTARFEYEAEFTTAGKYVPAGHLVAAPAYDKDSELYRRYTRLPDGPHIVRLDSLAKAIVGDETNPYRMGELVFDYIISNYPWAGAREYSTIECMPEYVLTERHGDCGQVSLLFISLMRTLGVPARWESGWMLHPGELNLHDWAEVYYEGIGWVPVDVSFGRYTTSDNPDVTGFYSHGIDAHRMAVNKAVGQPFFPRKKFVRSETVDFQVGEVESARGNLYYPAWNYHMEILSAQPIEIE